MVIRRFIAAVALVLATVTSAGAAEPVPGAREPVQCSLGGKNFAHSVKPLYNYEDAGYAAFRQFVGAEVFVPAQPGLTAEWLDRVLTSEVATGNATSACPRWTSRCCRTAVASRSACRAMVKEAPPRSCATPSRW